MGCPWSVWEELLRCSDWMSPPPGTGQLFYFCPFFTVIQGNLLAWTAGKTPESFLGSCCPGSATSLHLILPPTTTGGWVARKYFPYTSQLGTCMGGFGSVMLLLDSTAVPSMCSWSFPVTCGAAKLQECHLTKGWWSDCVHSSWKKAVQPTPAEVGLVGWGIQRKI